MSFEIWVERIKRLSQKKAEVDHRLAETVVETRDLDVTSEDLASKIRFAESGLMAEIKGVEHRCYGLYGQVSFTDEELDGEA